MKRVSLGVDRARRRLLAAAGASVSALVPAWGVEYPQVRPGVPLRFPADHGAHPAFRTEWWYVTGWLEPPGAALGFQITFFRTRPGIADGLDVPSAPRQLLFAHAALSDSSIGRLLHEERSARQAFGAAWAAEADTDVAIDEWTLRRFEDDRYAGVVVARDFSLRLRFEAGAPILLEGEGGYSRKGPLPEQASYYYSRPQLHVTGEVEERGRTRPVSGRAWLDHEWSSQYMAPEAQGWDWTGIDCDDGGALMAFRMRRADGSTLWADAVWRSAEGILRRILPEALGFTAVRTWRSPRTGAVYPVELRLQAGELDLVLRPLFDDQELDARQDVGAVYWEGAVTAWGEGRRVGRGYLELTGYFDRIGV